MNRTGMEEPRDSGASDQEAPAILGIGTALPPYKLEQKEAAGRLAESFGSQSDTGRWVRRLFRQCGVETRYTCEPDLLPMAAESRYLGDPAAMRAGAPTTAERMAVYKRESVPLALQAARGAMDCSYTEPEALTHLITVSCTGQWLPGLETELVKLLGLRTDIRRIPLTFVGCAAGLKAIGLAGHLMAGHPGSRILIVCVELCTLHLQPSGDRDALYGASFFGDGAAACVIGHASGIAASADRGIFQLGDCRTVLFPDSQDEMTWDVGGHGFDLYLSTQIPKLLGRFVPSEVSGLLGDRGRPDFWAIHPGGRGIVDVIQEMLALTDDQVDASRAVLRNYGNMSSATILFVLELISQKLQAEGDGATSEGMAVAFGPGLTAELVRMTYVPPVPGRTLEERKVAVYAPF
ncbi:type III polyketide synthase [Paenibacillus tarimensis]|uniref:type III polyketide synthase n=1 Tax=Paenibacillus tarimensis TaxID=416012 RepID=UPI001F31FF4C|nr:type III polyketide synthase [Paenibacillus tarimensis]MCF2944809.1 type III polyketide synthase [Paenibacillus tarimensis]